jgi:hypothetical protein
LKEHFHDGLLGTNVFGVRAMHTYVSGLLGLSKTFPWHASRWCLLVALFSLFSAAVSTSRLCYWCVVVTLCFRHFSFYLQEFIRQHTRVIHGGRGWIADLDLDLQQIRSQYRHFDTHSASVFGQRMERLNNNL